jgi:hypothetical protein
VPERPLAGLRVLDMTRVLAGPMATRLLAGFGAQVLRIDPPGYDEPNGIGTGDLTLGKRCATLDLRSAGGRAEFAALLAGADLLVHGLRPGALGALGLDADTRQAISPGLIEVTLNAYGWTGPWSGRRGFDTLVQNSAGLALAGGDWADTGAPYRWPLSILDHSAGYLMAAAAVAAVARRARTGHGSVSRVSLARVAHWLTAGPPAGRRAAPGPAAARTARPRRVRQPGRPGPPAALADAGRRDPVPLRPPRRPPRLVVASLDRLRPDPLVHSARRPVFSTGAGGTHGSTEAGGRTRAATEASPGKGAASEAAGLAGGTGHRRPASHSRQPVPGAFA